MGREEGEEHKNHFEFSTRDLVGRLIKMARSGHAPASAA